MLINVESDIKVVLFFIQVFLRKNMVIRLVCRRKQCLLCATPTFLKGFRPNFHRSFVIKCTGTYYQCFAIQTFLAELWPFETSVENLVSCYYSISFLLISHQNV